MFPLGLGRPHSWLGLMPHFVIFDVDGTLVDSVDLHTLAWEKTFYHFGIEVPYDQVRRQIGKGADQLMPVFWTKDELDCLGEAMQDFRAKLFQREYLSGVWAFPGVRKLLERLHADGKRVALATSAKKEGLSMLKLIAGIEGLVEGEASANDVEKSKPHPDIFRAALATLGDAAPPCGRG